MTVQTADPRQSGFGFADLGPLPSAIPLAIAAPRRVHRKFRPDCLGDLLQPRADIRRTFTIFANNGQRVVVFARVVELSSLIVSHQADGTANPAFPAALQPRDRVRAESMAQVRAIAGNLEPERLGIAADASHGAPIIGPDNVAESGNGHLAALALVYEDPNLSGQAARYRAFLELSGHAIAGFRAPVLVASRVSYLSDAERASFALAANERTTLAMSAAERARADQRRAASLLDLYRGGDITDAGNRDFVRGFLSLLSPEERGGLVVEHGGLSADGQRRLLGAVLAAAYGDHLGTTLDRFLNGQADGMKAIAGALADVAGRWAQLRAGAERGEAPDGADISADLAAAVHTVERARMIGVRVCDLAVQGDLERGPLAPAAQRLIRLFFRDEATQRGRGRPAIADALLRYVRDCLTAGGGPGLFGEAPAPATILEAAIASAAGVDLQQGLFNAARAA